MVENKGWFGKFRKNENTLCDQVSGRAVIMGIRTSWILVLNATSIPGNCDHSSIFITWPHEHICPFCLSASFVSLAIVQLSLYREYDYWCLLNSINPLLSLLYLLSLHNWPSTYYRKKLWLMWLPHLYIRTLTAWLLSAISKVEYRSSDFLVKLPSHRSSLYLGII